MPLLPMERIASYLDFSSLVSLATSTSSLAHLQPKEQLVKGEDFSVGGFKKFQRRTGQRREKREETEVIEEFYVDVDVKGEDFSVDGFKLFQPEQSRAEQRALLRREHYFDVEVKTRGLLGINMVWEWEGKVSRRELKC